MIIEDAVNLRNTLLPPLRVMPEGDAETLMLPKCARLIVSSGRQAARPLPAMPGYLHLR